MSHRILLSGPDIDESDTAALVRAVDGGWVAPVGPELNAFEAELATYLGAESCVALTSGTAALHLALLDAGVEPGDEVVVQSATFASPAFSVMHCGAVPVFCDITMDTWGLDPNILADLLAGKARANALPKAVIPVDLYGSCVDHHALHDVCARYEVALVEDAAEALGSITGGRHAGTFGRSAVLSFNGNKIITTSGGGALVGPKATTDRARFLSTQARSPVSSVYHEHETVGFNYRLSNLLAALGRSQLSRIEEKIARRTQIHEAYRHHRSLAAIDWGAYATTERPNYWLNVGLLPEGFSATEVATELGRVGIEARPAWKPMHLQPVFRDREAHGGAVSERLFERGLCLPSGSGLGDDEVDEVIAALAAVLEGAAARPVA